MRRRCLKFIAYLLLFLAVCFGLLLYNAASIFERFANQMLVERGGVIEIQSLSIRPESGLVVVIQKYQEPDVTLEDLRLQVPLMALLDHQNQLSVQVEIHKCSVKRTLGEGAQEPVKLHEQLDRLHERIVETCQTIVANVSQLPLQSLGLRIDDLQVSANQFSYQSSLTLQVDKQGADKLVSTLRSEGEYFGLQANINIDSLNQTVALDGSMSARDWEGISKNYLSELTAILSQKNAELYIDPLGASTFAEVSGYFRWNAQQPEHYNAAVLGNVGPSEVLMDALEGSTQSASFGIATNGNDVFRAYLTLPLEQLYVGTETYDSGELSLRIENQQCHLKMALGDNLVELSSRGYTSFVEGFGQVDFNTQLNSLGSGLIGSLAAELLPADLSFTANVGMKGRVDVDAWSVLAAKSDIAWSLKDVSWSSQSLSVNELSGVAQVDYEKEFKQNVSTTIQAGLMQVAGVDFTELSLALSMSDPSELGIRSFHVNTMGGKIYANDFTLKLKDRSSDPIQLNLERIQLDQLAKAVPQFKGELSGSVSGALIVQSKSAAFQINGGGLELDSEHGARLSYSMNGLLTQGLRPGTAAYTQYLLAERALEDLALQRFKIDFFPDSNETKPILLTFYGESTQEGTIVPVDYTLNVNANDSAGLIQLLQMMQRGELELN